MPWTRFAAAACAALLAASCSQMPAPVRVIETSAPPLPGTPPATRLTAEPPLPGFKPEAPQPTVPQPRAPAAVQTAERSAEDLMARIERILLADSGQQVEAVALETVASDTGPVTVYTVRPGDTLLQVADSLGLKSRDIAETNGLVKPYLLDEGRQLTVPLPGAPLESAPAQEAPPEPAIAEAEPGDDLQFIWPVRGSVVSVFGPKDGGLHNDGINIAAAAGTPILAAEDGVVSYVGNEIRGYGNLVLLRHADDWVTAYAHNARNLVARGQMVLRGDVIASVGASGGVSTPQSHFELRQGTTAVDPLRHLVES